MGTNKSFPVAQALKWSLSKHIKPSELKEYLMIKKYEKNTHLLL